MHFLEIELSSDLEGSIAKRSHASKFQNKQYSSTLSGRTKFVCAKGYARKSDCSTIATIYGAEKPQTVLVLPTVTDKAPLHLRVCLRSIVDVVTSFSPRTYIGCRREASAFLPASLAVVELFAANSPNAFLWSFSTDARTALRVSGESHSGLASQPPRKIKTGKARKIGPRLREWSMAS
jgi:hypothetical protein